MTANESKQAGAVHVLDHAESVCHGAVSHVGAANYPEREQEAHSRVRDIFQDVRAELDDKQREIDRLCAILSQQEERRRIYATVDAEQLAAAIAERDALSRQLSEAVGELNRRKGDAATRLHNICENLSEQANESPFTREEWERIDAENVALRRERDTASEALGRAMSDTEQLRDIADSVGLPALRAMANQMLEQGRAALANCAPPEEKP